MKTKQIKFIKFLVKYPGKWHSFASDRDTVEIVCSLVNLGIAKINQYNQVTLKSKMKADQFLNN